MARVGLWNRGGVRRARVSIRHVPLGLVGILLGMAAWEVAGRSLDVLVVPPFSVVGARLIELVVSGQILPHLMISLTNLGIGFGISLVVGIAVGMAMGWFRSIDYALSPYVNALLTAPSLVFAPIFFAFWGVGRETIVALIVSYSIWVVIVNTSVAIREMPQDLAEMAISYGASPRHVFRYIAVPAALPLIMAGIHVALGRAVKGMINGEMFIAVVGLGLIIMNAGRALDIPTVLAVLLVVLIVGLSALQVFYVVERRLTHWLPSTSRS